MSRVLPVDPSAPDADAVGEAARVLRSGGLVGLPTETVYGLAASALDEGAVRRIFAAKGRPPSHPLIAHVLDEDAARRLAAAWPDAAHRLASAFWPGPLTIVVDRTREVPSAVTGGGDSIALRAPSHAVARAVIRALGHPIAAPSANRFQGLSPTTADHVLRELGAHVDLILDAGPCAAGIESTVVDVRTARVRLLRPGALDLPSLRRIVPDIERADQALRGLDPRPSPGMQARHYAPRARGLIAADRAEADRIACGLIAQGSRVGLLVLGPTPGRSSERLAVRQLGRVPADYARALFATLRSLDEAGVDVVVVEAVPDDDIWLAVADRLKRAACPA